MSASPVARVVRLRDPTGAGHQAGPGRTGTRATPALSPQAGTDRPALPQPAGRVPAHLPDPRLGGLKLARRKPKKRQQVGLSFRIRRTTVRLRGGSGAARRTVCCRGTGQPAHQASLGTTYGLRYSRRDSLLAASAKSFVNRSRLGSNVTHGPRVAGVAPRS